MDTILNESLTPEEVNALMGVEQPQAAPGRAAVGMAGCREARPATGSARFLAEEHPQTAALVLSKLRLRLRRPRC